MINKLRKGRIDISCNDFSYNKFSGCNKIAPINRINRANRAKAFSVADGYPDQHNDKNTGTRRFGLDHIEYIGHLADAIELNFGYHVNMPIN